MEPTDLGSRIRERRAALGLTLDELARRAAVSRAMLSDVERGRKSPTVRILCQIAEGLGSTASDLLGGPETGEGGALAVQRREERSVLVDPRTGVERHLLSPAFLRRGIEVLWYVVPAGRSTGSFPPHRRGAEEHITVVQGRLTCWLGVHQVSLARGDSLFFRGDVTHEFRNPGPDSCHYFLIIDSSRAASPPAAAGSTRRGPRDRSGTRAAEESERAEP